MKMTIALLTFACLQAAANGHAQMITLSEKDAPLEAVIKKIERQSGYSFFYQSEAIRRAGTVSLRVRNASLGDVLTLCFKNRPLTFKVFERTVVIGERDDLRFLNERAAREEPPPPHTVKGIVRDESGEPVAGVSVQLKGSGTGTMSNTNGRYSINVPGKDDTLVFSSVGYLTKETAIGERTTIDVSLALDIQLYGGVVVVGYGKQSRRNVTGSIAKVDMKQIENLPNTNVAQALRGRVAGVQFTDGGRPGQGGTILIRGRRSISASNDPLIVLDGIFFEGSLNDINPADIESMEVLKDASATAIYGARAANGVILITSKMGTTEKPTIRFGGYYGVSGWSYKMKILSPERYIQKTLDWREQTGLESDPSKVADYLTPTEATNYTEGNTIDPWDVVSQSASIQNYDLSVSGRSGKTSYFISGNYNYDRGLVFMDQAKRISTRINLSNDITNWLKVGINAQYTERNLSGVPASVSTAWHTSPFSSVWLDDAHTDPNPFPTEETAVKSIIFSSIIDKNENIQRNLLANFYGIVDIPFIKGLSYRINYSPNYRWANNNTFSPIYQRNGRNDLGSASQESSRIQAWVWENILTYNKQVGLNHNFDLTLLYGRNQTFTQSLTGTGTDFSETSDINGWNNLSLAKIQTITTSASQVDAISSMARLNYRFMDRYLVTLTARRDGSSVFGKNHKFGSFPSVALAWIASEEPFFKTKFPDVEMLKLRLSYGSVGNQAITAYQSLTRQGQYLYVFGDGGSTSRGLYPLNLANADLTWETTTSANVAVDFELWKGKLGGTVEYYDMDTKDLLLTRVLPSPTGFPSILTNVGETNNKGIEVTLNTLNLRSGRFEWRSNFIFSTNKNKIVHLYKSDIDGDGKEDNDVSNGWFIGQPINVAFDYRIVGVYQEGDDIPVGQKPGFLRLEDNTKDNVINADDRQILGTLEPKYRWAITNMFSYGGFNLLLTVNSLQGWLARNSMLALDPEGGGKALGNFVERTNFLDAGWWTPENKSTTRSSLAYTNPYNHGYYQSRNFFRIQEVSLSYDFPRSMMDRFNMNSLNVYVSGRNLLTFTKWQGFDPESGVNFPMSRTVSFGFKTSF